MDVGQRNGLLEWKCPSVGVKQRHCTRCPSGCSSLSLKLLPDSGKVWKEGKTVKELNSHWLLDSVPGRLGVGGSCYGRMAWVSEEEGGVLHED